MAVLVKTCETFHLSNRLPWKEIKTKVEGVNLIDDHRAVMVFQKSAAKTTTLLGSNHIDVVKTCTVYGFGGDDADDADDHDEEDSLRAVLQASEMTTTRVTSSSHDFSVFRIDTDVCLDLFRCYQVLVRMGASVVMEHELHDALLIRDDRVVWSISDTVPQKILVSVPGVGASEARALVNASRLKVGLF
ncbi:unnamed protein product [Ectocarpus sp. 12 AP-2014]